MELFKGKMNLMYHNGMVKMIPLKLRNIYIQQINCNSRKDHIDQSNKTASIMYVVTNLEKHETNTDDETSFLMLLFASVF